jgi:hypothetical protein
MKRATTERDLEQQCCRWARGLGLAAVKLERNGNTGVPDVAVIASGGKVLFVEFKRPDGRGVKSEAQKFWAQFLGSAHLFVNSADAFKDAVTEYFSHELMMIVGADPKRDVRIKGLPLET